MLTIRHSQMAAFETAADGQLAHRIANQMPHSLFAIAGQPAAGELLDSVLDAVLVARALGLQRVPAITLFAHCCSALGATFASELPWAVQLFTRTDVPSAMLDSDFEVAALSVLDIMKRNGI